MRKKPDEHITDTYRNNSTREWRADCRCGWTGPERDTEREAKEDADDHFRVSTLYPRDV